MSTTVKAEVGRIVWHDLVTNDVEKAKGFYTKLLGWGIEIWKPGEMDYSMIQVNGQGHGGFVDPGQEVPSHWVGYVLVEDVDKAVSKARGAGATIHREPWDLPDVGRTAVIGDPQGAIICPFTPQTEVPASAGTFLWDELLTDDVEGAKKFYGEVFGWKSADVDMGPGTYTLFKRAGDVDAAGLVQRRPEALGPPAWLVYLAADDVDATVKKAKKLGATAHVEGMDIPTVGRIAVLQDPTGAFFGLFRPSGG